MAEVKKIQLNHMQKQLLDTIIANDTDGFKNLIGRFRRCDAHFVDENGMTTMQHACCKGNEEIVRILLDIVS